MNGTEAAVVITVALIGFAGVLVPTLRSQRRTRNENAQQHAAASEERQAQQADLLQAIGRVDGKLDATRADLREVRGEVGDLRADLTQLQREHER